MSGSRRAACVVFEVLAFVFVSPDREASGCASESEFRMSTSAKPRERLRHQRNNRFSRWRAASLVFVHVLILGHVVHWLVAGKTLAPLEMNEVMHTLELGIVTAGALFMLLALLATALFGRFFCSWACHILALQDLSAWALRRMRIKPRPVRSRLLLWVPIGVMLYMFLWPQVMRLLEGRAYPGLRFLDDEGGWASFLTSDFSRNLPGPVVAILTFLVCGFVLVYVLGSRSFCSYVCPYGAVFGLADRVAPGRIRSRDACTQCGTCTAVCDSGIRVHEETERYGTVVSPPLPQRPRLRRRLPSRQSVLRDGAAFAGQADPEGPASPAEVRLQER